MEKVTLIKETKHYVCCPHCGHSKTSVDHLFNEDHLSGRSFGPWYCDECGLSYSGKVVGNEVFVQKEPGRKDISTVFLKHGNVLLAVEGMYFDGDLNQEEARFFYNEHTCPTNFLKDVIEVYDISDWSVDPHGIFEFVGAIPQTEFNEPDDIKKLLYHISLKINH